MITKISLERFKNFAKYVPLINCIFILLFNFLFLFDIHYFILDFICQLSLLYIIFFYLSSNLLLFCWKHKLCIHYLSLVWTINLIDTYYKFPISNITYHLSIIIIGIIFYIYYLIKNYKLNK